MYPDGAPDRGAAPVFIFAMGLGLVYSHKQEPVQIFKRGVKLLVVALALNIARDVIPRLIVCLISGAAPDWEVFRYQLFNIDILHFAGLALMLTALLKKLKVPVLALVPIGIITLIIVIELSLIHLLIRKRKKEAGFVRFCGENLTTIYVVQWMIIGWMTSFRDYLQIDPGMEMSVVLGIVISLVSILIAKLLPRIKW